MSILLAVLAALSFGFGMALQQRAARTIPLQHALHPSLVGRLLSRPVWLAGAFVSGVGFLFQLDALRVGSVVTVQPIVTAGLVVCLAVTSWWDHEGLGLRAWVSVVGVVVGIAVFLQEGSAREAGVDRTAAGLPLFCTTVALVLLVGLCAARTRRHRAIGTPWAAGLGAAAGLANAYVAILARAGAGVVGTDLGKLLRSPYTYGVLASAVVAVVLVQAVYQARRPTVSLPVASVAEAGGSVALAMFVLGERPTLTGVSGTLAGLGLLVALVGLADLSRDEARRARPTPAVVDAPV
jgi:hypothetical protein